MKKIDKIAKENLLGFVASLLILSFILFRVGFECGRLFYYN